MDGEDDNKRQQAELETYLLLILSDSALPTGGFVASSGLESFVQHGFISPSTSSTTSHPFTLLTFLRESLISYAHLNLHFFQRAHSLVWSLRTETDSDRIGLDTVVEQITMVDQELEEMLLNHVTRRASKAQGIALLTLYSRAFAASPLSSASSTETNVETRMTQLMEALKFATRSKTMAMQGHLPSCFAVLCAALGLSLDRSLHLHLFLQARAILSSAVRLNLVGPYASQRLLLTDVRPVVTEALKEWQKRTSAPAVDESADETPEESGPATTWPLGEILAARHDQLHSRIFNS